MPTLCFYSEPSVRVVEASTAAAARSVPLLDITNTKDHSGDGSFFEPIWMEIHSIRLHISDWELVNNPTGMLNDKVIQAASSILKMQYPHYKGMEDPILCFAGQTTVNSCSDVRLVQIFNDPIKCHWITISNINCSDGQIDVYCSLLSLPSLDCLRSISAFVRVPVPKLEIRIVNVARQRDSVSCGFYAIANAHALLQGKDPRNMVYSENEMRQHLTKCFENNLMTPTPIQCFRTVRKAHTKVQQFSVYCICRKVSGKSTEDMVQCSFCNEWFHTACVGMGDNSFQLHCTKKRLSYTCQSCKPLF